MENKSARAKVQAFGGFLTAMVIPNIGAFIAWGFITALFIPTGWLPNEHFAKIVGPMITYLLPVMIGSTGGHLVGGKRGAVMGGIGTIGVIVGAEIPMFLGSMIMGPLGGLVIKYVDKALEKRIPAGFEMVINNFSLGIAGMLLCLLGFEVIGPAVLIANTFVKECIEALVHAGYLPLLSVINEPAKVLFLNNAIDQGVYYPLGMQQASVNGKSIFFMVASNPGPGLGLLLAFTLFGKGMSKRSAPGAMIIHFLGGIHELYFPYVLMKPLTIIAMIAGGMSGTWMFNLLDGGLVAGPSPGSIFAYLALTPKGSFLATIAGVTVGIGRPMATLTEDDVLEQLDAQDNLFSFMKTAHTILLQGIRQFLPSLFVDNDEEIVEYAVKPLLAQSGPLDDIDVALRLIYALGKMDKWLYADITHFSQFWHYLNEQDETPGFADDMTWDFISNVNSITRNAMLYDALKAMKFADFSVWSEARFSGMVKTALTLAVTTTLKELTP